MKKINTVKTKQLTVFLLMILFLLLLSGIIFYSVKQFAEKNIYRQMESQAEYYVRSVEFQLEEIMRQQSGFFVDRQLVFLVDELLMDDYDRRDALLCVQEKLSLLVLSNMMVTEATLFIPGSSRVITPNRFRMLDGEYQEQLAEIKTQLGRLVPKDGNLQYSLSETPYAESVAPYFFLQIVLDGNQLVSQLNNFTIQEGGSCWYQSETGWFLEDTTGIGIAKEILEKIESTGEIEKVQVDGVHYLVNTMESDYLGILIQYCSEKVVLEEMEQYTMAFYGFILLAVVCAVIFSSYTERLVNRPLQKLYRVFQELQRGNMEIQISHSAGDEFEYIYEGFNRTVQDLKRMIDEVYVQKNLTAKAELKQLQAQISPHFLYNSFFLFSSRVGREDFEGAKVFAEYLGTYFQYLAKNTSDIVTLTDEMLHAEAYARIQESRFASRMELIWKPIPEEAANIMVPRLIVQPILENSYKYGLEEREEDGILHVYYGMEAGRLSIYIENNGEISEETIQTMQNRLSDTYKGEVTGMINVHKRLKNYFKQQGGINISKGTLGGTLVVINVPMEWEAQDV